MVRDVLDGKYTFCQLDSFLNVGSLLFLILKVLVVPALSVRQSEDWICYIENTRLFQSGQFKTCI